MWQDKLWAGVVILATYPSSLGFLEETVGPCDTCVSPFMLGG